MKQFYFLITILLLVHCQVFGQSVPTYVPTNGLVGWWPFNGNAQDGSGNGNHLTNYGAQLTTDRFGINNSCYSFNGNSNYLSRGVFGLINCTVSIWAYTTSYPLFHPYGPPESVFFYNGYGDVAGFGLRAAHSKLLVITGGINGDVTNSNFLPALNNWYNLVLVKSSNNYSLYSNGQLLSSGSAGMNPYAGLFVIGAGHSSDNSFSGYYSGKIDDIGIWNRALTQQEITNLYNAQSPCQVSITSQPVNQTVGTNRNVQFSVVSSDSSSTYRWQSNSGFGFQDLYNAGQYLGVNTSTLSVSNTSPQNDNQLFRCIVSTTDCGIDTSDVATLNVNSLSNSNSVPNKFNYQLVVRDTSGQLVTNRPVSMRLSLQRGPQMSNLYTETHQLTTNSNGLLTTTIGTGIPTQSSIDSLDWSLGDVFAKTEIDMNGGSNYSLVSTRELLSVPYALYSLNSGNSTPGPVGPMGPQGPTGATGPQGPAGNNAISTITNGNINQVLKKCNGTLQWLDYWDKCPPPPLGSVSIGSSYGGGIVFYVDSLGHGLVCAPNDIGTYPFGCSSKFLRTVEHYGSGLLNTLEIIRQCEERIIAASACDNYTNDGFTDWYLPSKEELRLMLQNLQLQGIGNFSNNLYLSSSEYNAFYAYYAERSGNQINIWGFNGPGKGPGRVRPIRSF